MKIITPFIVGIFFSSLALAEIWQAPDYQADENHPADERQEEQYTEGQEPGVEQNQRDEKRVRRGHREKMEEATTPHDYTTGEDSDTPARARR